MLLLLLVIDLVKFALLVLALLQQIAVAVDIDMEIAVELDDALIGARLFPDGGIGNGELVLDADVALLLVLLFVA